MYPYNAYLFSLLQFHPSAKKTHMQAWVRNEDTPGNFSDLNKNDGHEMHMVETMNGEVWEIIDSLFLDMIRQLRYLLPSTNAHLKLLLAKADFVLLADNVIYDYEIVKCKLQMRRIYVMDTIISGHNKGLD